MDNRTYTNHAKKKCAYSKANEPAIISPTCLEYSKSLLDENPLNIKIFALTIDTFGHEGWHGKTAPYDGYLSVWIGKGMGERCIL